MLELRDVTFSYDQKPILKDFSLTLADGEILAVMGPSGCGKSTLLSLCAGLLRPQKGFVISSFDRISFVFQEPRLFPWLTVRENLAAGLKKTDGIEEIITDALDTVGLSDCKNLYPEELSGGMKSRVSLARARVFDGDLFLFDEPFAALDEELRKRIGAEMRRHLKERGAAAIFVTHQLSDAEMMADRILYLPSANT